MFASLDSNNTDNSFSTVNYEKINSTYTPYYKSIANIAEGCVKSVPLPAYLNDNLVNLYIFACVSITFLLGCYVFSGILLFKHFRRKKRATVDYQIKVEQKRKNKQKTHTKHVRNDVRETSFNSNITGTSNIIYD